MILVAAGGGVGAVSRYLIGTHFNLKYQNENIPVAMLIVNVIGAGGLGLFLGSFYETIAVNLYDCSFYLCFGVGFFGAFTTFSTFSVEAISLLQRRNYKSFTVYILLSLVGCIVAFSLGFLSMA